jgi:hypothetical protein
MIGRLVEDEKLRTIGVGTTISHADNTPSRVEQLGVWLIVERLPPYRFASSPSASRITTLNHKIPTDDG